MFSEDIFERIHDMAMSDDPLRAVKGRLAKAMASAVDGFLDAEFARGTCPLNVTAILPRTVAFVMAETLLHSVHGRPDQITHIMRLSGELVRDDLAQIASDIESAKPEAVA